MGFKLDFFILDASYISDSSFEFLTIGKRSYNSPILIIAQTLSNRGLNIHDQYR